MHGMFFNPERFVFACCGCWLLPALVLVFLVSLVHTLRMTWWRRGMEPGQRYCARCRFDLRGGGGMSCPECGCDLSKGNILARDVEPPMPTVMFAGMITPLTAGPIVMVAALFLVVLPVNYDRSVRAEFVTPSTVLYEIVGSADYRHGGDKPYTLQIMVEIDDPGMYSSRRYPLLEMSEDSGVAPAVALTRERFVARLTELGGELDDPAQIDDVYERTLALAEELWAGGRFKDDLAAQLGADVYAYTEFNPHLLLLVLVIFLVIAAWLGVMHLAVRAHRRTIAGYQQNKAWLVEKYSEKVAGVSKRC